jgi:hypothetical protein
LPTAAIASTWNSSGIASSLRARVRNQILPCHARPNLLKALQREVLPACSMKTTSTAAFFAHAFSRRPADRKTSPNVPCRDAHKAARRRNCYRKNYRNAKVREWRRKLTGKRLRAH